jgi:hypothetical protein
MSFDFQPTLKGELLELRPLRAEDFDDLYAVASDPLIWEQHPIRDRYKEEVFKSFFREALESGGALIVIDSRAEEKQLAHLVPNVDEPLNRPPYKIGDLSIAYLDDALNAVRPARDVHTEELAWNRICMAFIACDSSLNISSGVRGSRILCGYRRLIIARK